MRRGREGGGEEYGDGHFTAAMLLTTKTLDGASRTCAAEICDNVTNFPIIAKGASTYDVCTPQHWEGEGIPQKQTK